MKEHRLRTPALRILHPDLSVCFLKRLLCIVGSLLVSIEAAFISL